MLFACSQTMPQPFRVVGYEASWATEHNPRYGDLTHLNYAFLTVNPDGSVNSSATNPAKLQNVLAQAHQAGLKVLISVGGGDNQEMSSAVANARANLEKNILQFVQQYQFDGVDIDWEDSVPGFDGQAYLELLQDLSAQLHPKGLLLTSAIDTGHWFGQAIPSQAFTYLDFANIMAYDGDGIEHSPLSLAESALNYWTTHGLPKEKAVLGLPFYGYNAAGRETSNATPYKDIIAINPDAAHFDTSSGYGYNGIPTIMEKTKLATREASGVMIWELSHDTNDQTSLLTAIRGTIKGMK